MRKPLQLNPYWYAYRAVMRLAHRFNWHYMKPSGPYEDGARMLWCHWCGARHVIPPASNTLRRSE